MNTRIIAIFALVVLLVCESQATIRRVAKDGDGTIVYNNIQTAINACYPGDTVIVSGNMGPWTISGNLTIDRRIVLMGQGNGCQGIPSTQINANGILLTADSDGTLIEGVFYSDDQGIGVDCYGSTVTIRRCMLQSPCSPTTDVVIGLRPNSSCMIENCVVIGCGYCIQCYGTGVQLTIRNSVFASLEFRDGIVSYDQTTLFWISNSAFLDMSDPILSGNQGSWYLDHNIFWDNGTWNGTISGPVTASYNAMDNAAFANFPGTNKINLQGVNPFVSYDGTFTPCAEDLHLHPVNGAALIDGGDPNAPNDRDGTRRDLGIYGGPTPFVDTGAPDFPFVTNFFVPSSVPANGVLEIRSTGRVGLGQ